MEIRIIQTKKFTALVDSLLKKRLILEQDFAALKKQLVATPNLGILITNTGGVRKIRLKSASRGKSAGFRVCYYFITQENELYLIHIYAKNVQENLTSEEKIALKMLVKLILQGNNHEFSTF